MKLSSATAIPRAASSVATMQRPGCKIADLRSWPELERYVESLIDEAVVPSLGVVAYLRGQCVFSKCAGGLSRSTIIRVYSMTKVLTAVCVLMLVEAGDLSLDTRVASVVEDWAGETTMWDLLTHTSGLTYGFWADDPVALQYRQQGLELPHPITEHSDRVLDKPATLAEFCRKLSALPRPTVGSYRYSASFDVLGHVVERVSGLDFATFCHHRVFEPLGMRDTFFRLPAGREGHLAPCAGRPDDDYSHPAPPSGGGGLLSTINDWHAFLEGLRAGKLLARLDDLAANHLARRHIPPTCLAQIYPGIGLGVWSTADPSVPNSSWLPRDAGPGTFGWTGAAGTSCLLDPRTGLAIVIATQLLGATEKMHHIYVNVHHAVYAALKGKHQT